MCMQILWLNAGGGVDFSTEAMEVTFPADEGEDGVLVLGLTVTVDTINDDIDEADIEYFILYLSPKEDPLPGLTFSPSLSVGGISDDDCRFYKYAM